MRNVVQVSRAASDAVLNGHRDRAEQLLSLKGVGPGSGNNQHLRAQQIDVSVTFV